MKQLSLFIIILSIANSIIGSQKSSSPKINKILTHNALLPTLYEYEPILQADSKKLDPINSHMNLAFKTREQILLHPKMMQKTPNKKAMVPKLKKSPSIQQKQDESKMITTLQSLQYAQPLRKKYINILPSITEETISTKTNL